MKNLAIITNRPEKGIYKVLENNGIWAKLQDERNQFLPFMRLTKTISFIN